jgi:acyl-coenzyme A thioesterase PaaI-like protein
MQPDPVTYPDDFWGAVNVPFHRRLGVVFSRANPHSPGALSLPASAELTGPDGRHSAAAAYALAEMAAGVATCECLLPHVADRLDAERPAMLTTAGSFAEHGPAVGELRAEARVATDPEAAVRELRSSRKVKLPVAVDVLAGDGGLAAEALFDFQFRLMSERQYGAMMTLAGAAAAEVTPA